jgi:hypothetical protein
VSGFEKDFCHWNSGKLSAEFGNGLPLSNLKLMRQFYVVYAPRISQTLPGFSHSKTPRPIIQTLSELLAASETKRPITLC